MNLTEQSFPQYSGHPSCPAVFLNAISHLPSDRPVALMVPPITARLEETKTDFLKQISDRKDIELSLNDWGTLYQCALLKKKGKLKASLTAGVLLAGQNTDPLIRSFLNPETGSSQWRALGTPSIFSCETMLTDLGVERIEVCSQPVPFCGNVVDLRVTCFSESVVSVFPCCEKCDKCSERYTADPIREKTGLYMRQNMLLHSGFPTDWMPYMDRVLSFGGTL